MPPASPPRWLHYLAVGTVCAALPLLFLGAEVTTKHVGMVDSRAVVSPFQAIGEFLQGNQSMGWAIEHSHRLFGWMVGALGILVAAGAWWKEPRRWITWLATLALVFIIVQGLLGGFRVHLNAWFGTNLAMIHGWFAQIVFAMLVSVALLTSPGWTGPPSAPSSPALRRWSLISVLVVFLQLILGGLVRHQNALDMARFHWFGAFLVLAVLLWLVKLASEEQFTWPTRILIGLLVLQIVLGVEAGLAWMARFVDPSLAIRQSTTLDWVRSGHYVLGALIFSTTVVIALQARRGLAWFVPTVPVGQRSLEGAI